MLAEVLLSLVAARAERALTLAELTADELRRYRGDIVEVEAPAFLLGVIERAARTIDHLSGLLADRVLEEGV